jgi:hypothetical protein
MKSVIVIFSSLPDLERMSEAYGGIGSTNLRSPERLVVEGDWGWFAIGIDDEVEGEYSDTERTRITQIIPDPVFSQLEYSGSRAADLAIRFMPASADTLIDNDHGLLRPIGEVRELIQAGVEWQTRST